MAPTELREAAAEAQRRPHGAAALGETGDVPGPPWLVARRTMWATRPRGLEDRVMGATRLCRHKKIRRDKQNTQCLLSPAVGRGLPALRR